MALSASRLCFWLFLALISSLISDGVARCEADPYAIAQIIPDDSLGSENSTVRADTIKNTPSDL